MEILLRGIAKHFGNEVVLEGVDIRLAPGSRTAILGANGSGKSTLLQLIAGALVPTAGTLEHRRNGVVVPPEDLYREVGIAAPYLGLYEDLTLREAVGIHMRFKPLRQGLDAGALARIAYLDQASDKPVLHFSSGMKQRLKLALAILSDTPLLLLDEPASNLDGRAIAWYRELLLQHMQDRTVLIASNHLPAEHDLCDALLEIGQWKEGTTVSRSPGPASPSA